MSWAHVDELRPNPRNPRVHGPEVHALARTIVRTAWGAPIVAQRKTKRIIGGHGRLEAAKEILAGIEIDGELRGGADYLFDPDAPGPGYVPVRWVDVNDATADAMTIADNSTAIQGKDDLASLQAMASGVAESIRLDLGVDQERLNARIGAAANAILRESPPVVASHEGEAAHDPHAEWQGMPDFKSEDLKSHSKLIVHFRSDEDEQRFLDLIGARVTYGFNASRSVWYPPQDERFTGSDPDSEYRS